MKIDDSLIAYLENLSRLKLTADECAHAKTDLGEIIGYMAKLSELDTEEIPPLSHPSPQVNRFRDDTPKPSYPREEMLANAPEKTGEYFSVPRAVE